MPERENPEMLWLSLSPNQPVRGFFDLTEIINKIKPHVVNDGDNFFVRSKAGEQYLQCKEGLFCIYWGDEYARFERSLEDGELEILNSDVFQNRTRTLSENNSLVWENHQMEHVIHAVTILDVSQADPLDVTEATSFEATREGREAAQTYFEEKIRSVCEDFDYSEEDTQHRVEIALENGYFEIGDGYIALINS